MTTPSVEIRHNQDPKPKKRHSVFWDSTVDAIEQFLILVLNCPPSYVALGGCARERTMLDDDDVFGGSDLFVDKATRVELPRSPYDLLLELLRVHRTLLQSLDEQGRRRSAAADHNALENKFTTGSTDVVLDRPELANDKHLRMVPSRSCGLTWCHTLDCSRI